jgi:hypothetical protein
MHRSNYLWALLLLLAGTIGLPGARAEPRVQEQDNLVFLPLAQGRGNGTPPAGSLPATLVGTWFYGQLLPRALYDPATGQWGSANGLGQMYEFGVGGGFTYMAFFRIENPGCSSEVSVYRRGTARADGATLRLHPVVVKTRTVINCGGTTEKVTEGPYDERILPWSVARSQQGVKHLTISEDGKTTAYYKDGMAEELVGSWRQGEIRSAGFYNPATGVFNAEPGEGWWISITADGRYRWGEFGYGRNEQGCDLVGWVYLEGTVRVSGSHVTFTPQAGVVRVENACAPDQPRQEPWKDDAKGLTWLFHDYPDDPKLVLIPDGRFEEYVFLPEA